MMGGMIWGVKECSTADSAMLVSTLTKLSERWESQAHGSTGPQHGLRISFSVDSASLISADLSLILPSPGLFSAGDQ